MTLLDVRDLSVSYRTGKEIVHAVRGVSFSLESGQVMGIAGESGSGKTTVGLSLLRLLPPSARVDGEVLLNGEDLRKASWGRLRAVRWAGASVVFQGAMSALNPVRTIGDQICEPIQLHEKTSRAEARERAGDLLDSVGVPRGRRGSYPHELSGGQRQRVMIAMALACSPDLVIADEPTTALDVIVQAQILSLLATRVREAGIGMIIVSHDLSVLGSNCDRLAVMYGGRLVETGPSRELMEDGRHPYTRLLCRAFSRLGDPASRLAPAGLPGEPPPHDIAGCPFAPRCPEATDECGTAEVSLRPAGPARESACIKTPVYDPDAPAQQLAAVADAAAAETAPEPARVPQDVAPPAPGTTPLIEVSGLRIVFPPRRGQGPARAVDDVNLNLGAGEILALIGESGCGKSTLCRALVGLATPSDGQVRYAGEPLRYSARALKQHRRRVQLVLQDPAGALNPRQNVFDAVAEGPRLHGMRDGLTARVRDSLARAGLRPPEQFFARYPHQLSGGQQQRVVIAGALALEPTVLVADEPVSSLDASVRGEILRLILDLRAQLSLAAIIVSHDLALAWNVADRVAVMYLGRVVESGPVADVLLRPKHPYTQALVSVLEGPGVPLGGEPPDPARIPQGCRFHPRCPKFAALGQQAAASARCTADDVPVLVPGAGHDVACFLADAGIADAGLSGMAGAR